jgi:hypothetical protein
MLFVIGTSGWVKQTGREQNREAISGVEKEKICWKCAMLLKEKLKI